MKVVVRLLLSIMVMLALAGCAPATTQGPAGGTAAPGGPSAALTLVLDWTPNTNHTGIFVAQEKGWYAEEGLAVNVIQPGQGAAPDQLVGSNQAEVGISFQESVTNARAAGVPIVSIGAIIQHNTSAFVSMAEKGITSPKDFEGKTYGSFGLPLEGQILDVLMRCDGGDPSLVKIVEIGSTDPLTAIQRDIDFAWIYEGWEGIEATRRNMPVNFLHFVDWTKCLPDYYTPVFISNEQMIKANPEALRGFMAATARGYEFAIKNPAEAAEILIKNAPEANADLIRQSQAWISPRYQADAAKWGIQEAEVWQRYTDWLSERGLLTQKIDVIKAFTNDFLPAQP